MQVERAVANGYKFRSSRVAGNQASREAERAADLLPGFVILGHYYGAVAGIGTVLGVIVFAWAIRGGHHGQDARRHLAGAGDFGKE